MGSAVSSFQNLLCVVLNYIRLFLINNFSIMYPILHVRNFDIKYM